MNGKIFLDTNIVVYSYSNNEAIKQGIARGLITDCDSYVSTQVLQELTNTVTKKLGFDYAAAIDAINECTQNNKLHVNTHTTILKACDVAQQYRFSFYDSLIIAAALECNCTTLYSEDLHNSQIIDGKLKIVNPFV